MTTLLQRQLPLIKTNNEIEGIRGASAIINKCFQCIEQVIAPGVSADSIEKLIATIVHHHQASPSFEEINDFPFISSISINSEICHGLPLNSKIFKTNDLVSIDIGVRYNGFCSDAAKTYLIGPAKKGIIQFYKNSLELFYASINILKPGVLISSLGKYIEDNCKSFGINVFPQFAGHGIGTKPHEPPKILHVYKSHHDIRLTPNMVFTVEPIFTRGETNVIQSLDGFTFMTCDHEPTILFEHTLYISETGPVLLTNW